MRKVHVALFVNALLLIGARGSAVIDPATEPMSFERVISLLETHPQVTTLDQVPALLPDDFLMNFVLKHGVKRLGERGHLVETKVSQSADPLAPRAILFDERTGFSISYNGGGAEQTANQRLDILSFESTTKTFSLQQIDFPIQPGHPVATVTDCATCHGPDMRPIFSMYPDWPAFYGSDNDELTGPAAVQKKEAADYKLFLQTVVPHHPRYSPLYSNERTVHYLKRKLYPSFPYRPDTSAKPQDVSRAFAFRPELRLGIVYNRLIAQSVAARITKHPRFAEFGPYFLFNLLQCSWPKTSAKPMERWLSRVETALQQKPKTLSGGLLDYRQNLALFELRVNDVDIRYSYNHEGYKNQDASKKVMEIGYIGRYFNSYFDGTATIDELLAAALYTDLSAKFTTLHALIKPRGLVAKYQHLVERFKFDQAFFAQMDRLGRWIAVPYPKELATVHHRESFTPALVADHQKLCQALAGTLQ